MQSRNLLSGTVPNHGSRSARPLFFVTACTWNLDVSRPARSTCDLARYDAWRTRRPTADYSAEILLRAYDVLKASGTSALDSGTGFHPNSRNGSGTHLTVTYRKANATARS